MARRGPWVSRAGVQMKMKMYIALSKRDGPPPRPGALRRPHCLTLWEQPHTKGQMQKGHSHMLAHCKPAQAPAHRARISPPPPRPRPVAPHRPHCPHCSALWGHKHMQKDTCSHTANGHRRQHTGPGPPSRPGSPSLCPFRNRQIDRSKSPPQNTGTNHIGRSPHTLSTQCIQLMDTQLTQQENVPPWIRNVYFLPKNNFMIKKKMILYDNNNYRTPFAEERKASPTSPPCEGADWTPPRRNTRRSVTMQCSAARRPEQADAGQTAGASAA